MAFDSVDHRLFVAALGNNTVEAIDVPSGVKTGTIRGLAEPQGLQYVPETQQLWIANGGDGTVRIFDVHSFQPISTLRLDGDADNIRRDPATHQIYVGYGEGGIAVFDTSGRKVADVKLAAHPESFQLEKDSPRMYVNLPEAHKVDVIDRRDAKVISSWQTADAQANFPMALDEGSGRLFVVCRKPALLLVMDTQSGAIVARLPTVGDSDDVAYDPQRKRIYVSGGEGAIAVYQLQGRDRYAEIARIPTVPGARTSLLVPELNRIFVAVRQQGTVPAAIRIYTLGK